MAANGLEKANFVLMLALVVGLALAAYYAFNFVQTSPLAKVLLGAGTSGAPTTDGS